MTMAAAVDEREDLKTCWICFHEYDDDTHKPKFLSCHHTFCLECIKILPRGRGGFLTCPKCTKKMRCPLGKESELSSNPYALYLSEGNNNNNPTEPPLGLPIHEGRWCTNCKKEAVPSCMADHSTFSMGSKSAEFCHQLLSTKDLNEAQLISIIQERKEARTYLHEVSNAHKLVGEAIRRLEDENNVHFVQMNSLLDNSTGSIKEDETAQSLSLKLEETADMIKEELKDVQVLEKTYLRHINGKTKIKFACYREGKRFNCNMPVNQQGVDANNQNQMNQRKMLKAATHVLLSLLDIDDRPQADPPAAPAPPATKPGVLALAKLVLPAAIKLAPVAVKPAPVAVKPNAQAAAKPYAQAAAKPDVPGASKPATVAAKPGSSLAPPPPSPPAPPGPSTAPPPPAPPVPTPALVAIIPRTNPVASRDNFGFAMTFCRFDTNLGTVTIKPAPHFNRYFRIGSFGHFYVSGPPFPLSGASIGRAFADSFVTIPGIFTLMQLLFPFPAILPSVANATTEKDDPLDVKLVSPYFGNASNGYLDGFEMAFLLNQLEHQWNSVKRWKRSILFGKIVGGENVIDSLSRTNHVNRHGFTIFVDYRTL